MDAKTLYSMVYEQNLWGSNESASGHGSELATTRDLITGLRPLLDECGISSVLDCPCGDWAWMRHVDLDGLDYLGADIVDAIIANNAERYARPGVTFGTLDIINEVPPYADVIIVKDLFIHFRLSAIAQALCNIEAAGIPWLLTTHYTDMDARAPDGTPYFIPTNSDLGGSYAMTIGCDFHFRPLNLVAPPFNWPEPLRMLPEAAGELGGPKSLALWRFCDLPVVWR